MDLITMLSDPALKSLGSFGMAATVGWWLIKKNDNDRKERELKHDEQLSKERADFKALTQSQQEEFKRSLQEMAVRKEQELKDERELYRDTIEKIVDTFEKEMGTLNSRVAGIEGTINTVKGVVVSLQTSQELIMHRNENINLVK